MCKTPSLGYAISIHHLNVQYSTVAVASSHHNLDKIWLGACRCIILPLVHSDYRREQDVEDNIYVIAKGTESERLL